MIEGLVLDFLVVNFSGMSKLPLHTSSVHQLTNLQSFWLSASVPSFAVFPHPLFLPVCTTALPSQKVQKHQLKAAKLGTALMETTEQNIWDRLVTQIQGKMHLCPKLLELVESGNLEIISEVKHGDCFSSFGPQLSLFFYKNIHSIDQ